MVNRGPIVQVETTGALGQQTVKQVALDTNRVDVHIESLQRFGNLVALPSRGIYTDGVLWVLSVAVPLRLLDSAYIAGLLPAVGLLAVFGLLAVPLLLAICMVFLQLPSHRLACIYRAGLVVCGFLLALFSI